MGRPAILWAEGIKKAKPRGRGGLTERENWEAAVAATERSPFMPRKIRELIRDLEQAGFVDRGGRGSHRNDLHPGGGWVTVSGKLGDHAKPYQERAVRQAITESQENGETES